jgi:selenocysteine-specific elongation factor
VAARVRRRDEAGIARLGRLRSADPSERAAAALDAIGLGPWTEASLCRDSGVPLAEVAGVVAGLAGAGRLVDIPLGPRRSRRVSAEAAADLESRVEATLARLHEASPRHSAIGRARVSAALAYLGDDALVAGLIDRLRAKGRVTADARSVALSGHEPRLSQAERRLKAEIAEAYRAGGMTPPEPSAWMVKGHAKGPAVAELLALLCDEERLVHVGPDLYLDFDVAASLRKAVVDRLADGSSLSMAGLRDLLGTTRKYAVPIGEYLDRIGLTRREGDVRRLVVAVEVVKDADA